MSFAIAIERRLDMFQINQKIICRDIDTEKLYSIISSVFEDYDVTLSDNVIIAVPHKRKISLYYNSFIPNMKIYYEKNSDNSTSICNFALQKSVKRIIYLIWFVLAFFLVMSVVTFDIGFLFISLVFFIVTIAFAYLGLYISSKFTKRKIEKALDII